MTDRPVRPLRILAIERYFWPDSSAYGAMLRRKAERWVQDGHYVEVLAGQPGYRPELKIPKARKKEMLDGVTIHRISLLTEDSRSSWRRLPNFLIFAARIFTFIVRRRRFDVVMAATFPPVVTGFAAALAARLRGARFIYHCLDIQPEAGRLAGEFRREPVYRLLQRVDSMTCRMAARVVALSRDMQRTLENRPGHGPRAVCVRSTFATPEFDSAEPVLDDGLSRILASRGRFRIVFAGNIGRFQGLDGLLDVILEMPATAAVELLFIGVGKARPALEHKAESGGGDTVVFVDHQPVAVANLFIRSADLCVVSLMPGVYRYAFPSKLATYLHEGRPLLVIAERDSSLYRIVLEHDIGLAVDHDDLPMLADRLIALVHSPDRLAQMARNAKMLSRRQYSTETNLDFWSRLIREV